MWTCSVSSIGPGARLTISLGRSGPSSSVGLAGRAARCAGVGSGIAVSAFALAAQNDTTARASVRPAALLRANRDGDRRAILALFLQLDLTGRVGRLEVDLGVMGVLLGLGHRERRVA